MGEKLFTKKKEYFSDFFCKKIVTFYSPKLVKKSFTKKSENFSESVKFSIKKSPKLVTFYSMKISQKLVTNSSSKKVKILVNHKNFL